MNHLGESNHGSGGRNITPLQKRPSSPNFYLKPREEETSVSGKHTALFNCISRYK